jgi:hypothetical protein
MDLSTLAFYIGIYLVFGFLLSVMAMLVMDVYDYLFAFLMFWPIALITASVYQLIHFVKEKFKGEN